MQLRACLARLSARLYTLTALCGVGLAAMAGVALWSEWEDAVGSRIAQLQSLTEVAARIAETNRALVLSGAVTEDAAKTRAIAQIVAMTYGDNDYFLVTNTQTGINLGSTNPQSVGKDGRASHDSTGFYYIADVLPRAVRDGVATVAYQFPRLEHVRLKVRHSRDGECSSCTLRG